VRLEHDVSLSGDIRELAKKILEAVR